VTWTATRQVDADLIAGRDFLAADSTRAATAFLDVAFKTFDAIAAFPKAGTSVRLRHPQLKILRFVVLPHPFNRWLVFYRPRPRGAVIVRVLYGTVNWRQEPDRFF
jgi:plasmid stabilization system protein ParE